MSYEEQLSAARFRAERDQARQECERLRARLRDSVPREAYERKRAAWLRQIRECETALHRRRECIKRLENAALERRAEREAYREAAEWVREHGGLDAVKRLLDWVVGHCSTEQQLDFDFWLSGRVMHELGFEEDMADRDEVERRLLARLVPEGMEWPKYTDGEPVRIGGRWERDGCDTSITYIERIIFAEDGVYLDNDYNEAFYRHGERVKRPEPKALGADGVEIREGDTIYSDGCKEGLIVDGYQHDGSLIAHKRDGSHVFIRKPQHFTHAKPEIDTWERIEEDAGCTATKYNERRGTIFTTKQQVARDLVRRARALAERGK